MSNEVQSSLPRSGSADEINRLHAEAEQLRAESRDTLHVALVAAWKASQLLLAEKRNVRRTMRPGAWILWLERHFAGTPRTAQHYNTPRPQGPWGIDLPCGEFSNDAAPRDAAARCR